MFRNKTSWKVKMDISMKQENVHAGMKVACMAEKIQTHVKVLCNFFFFLATTASFIAQMNHQESVYYFYLH